MNRLPNCHKCKSSPFLHALMGGQLACKWDGKKATQIGDWGEATPIVIEETYLAIGKKVPQGVLSAAIRARKEGVTL